jgi:type II secretory pathway component PulF
VSIVLTYVIPALMPLFENSDSELPLAARTLIATSEFVKSNWLFIIFAIVFFVIAILIYKTTDS